MARGRPTAYNDKVVKEILERLAEGQSLRSICADEHMPAESTVRAWALDDYKGFSAQYTRAREIGYLSMADELLDVSDDARNDWMERRGEEDAGWVANGEHIQRSRLRVDTRKWLLSKTLPKIYGDKLTHQGTGEGGEFVFKFSFE